MKFSDRPIRWKLMTIILVVSGVVSLLTCTALFAYEFLTFRQALLTGATIRTRIIAANSTAALAFANDTDATEVLAALRADPHVVAAGLYDGRGRLFAHYPVRRPAAALPAAPTADGIGFAGGHLVAFEPVTQDGKRLGTLYLQSDLTEMAQRFRLYALIMTLVIALSFAVAYLLSRVLQQRISAPILRLAETARAITERRDYTVRAGQSGHDELGRLTEAFNQLLVQIDAQKTALDAHSIVAITDRQGRLTYVNDKFCAISGYPREDLLGQDHRIVNSGHHAKEFFRELWTTIAHGRVWQGEIRNRARNGTFYWIDTTIVPFLDADGQPYEYAAISADITARQQAREQIQLLNQGLEQRVRDRTAQLEAANQELEAFSYSVSHDLRAPLRHVDGFAGLLLKSDGHLVSERGRGYLANITGSAKQMGLLIDDLLVFSQMGRSEMRLAPVDLKQLAEETIQTLRSQHPARNIVWRPGPLPVVRGDRPMLRQVFVNLFANAVKYTGPRDQAEIAFGCDDDPTEGHVIFVHDNGVGFEMAYAHKLFGVFQRLHRAEEFEGTGIGLANVRRIISRHGGRTWAEGEPDRGATFYFTLPSIPEHP